MPKPHPLFSGPDTSEYQLRKVVIVGQAPSKKGAAIQRAAIGGPVGDKLMLLAGRNLRGYVREFRRLNLLQDYPGRDAGTDSFPLSEARRAWSFLAPNLNNRRVVFLGNKVADIAVPGWRAHGVCVASSFYDETIIRLCVVNRRFMRYFVLPHPSGLNRWWNDPNRLRMAADAFRCFINNPEIT